MRKCDDVQRLCICPGLQMQQRTQVSIDRVPGCSNCAKSGIAWWGCFIPRGCLDAGTGGKCVLRANMFPK